jgi:toxin YoeB
MRIVWTLKAQSDRRKILAYWKARNKSVVNSKKLDQLIRESLNLIQKYPCIGKPTNRKNIRIKVVRDYFLIYEITNNEIVILRIRDSRQNPKELERTIK